MASRREFISTGLVIAGATCLPAVPILARATDILLPALDCFIFDTRFELANAVAQQASQQGIPLAAMTGDLMDLWYDHLDLRWKQAPRTLAGLTTTRALFVLETLAADRGMTVVQRSAHATGFDTSQQALSNTVLIEWLIAPRKVAARLVSAIA